MAQINLGSTKVKKIYLGNTQIKKVYLGSTKVYTADVTVTDLVRFKGWSIYAHESRQAGVNTTNETSTVNISTGIVLYGSAPPVGLNTGGDIGQNITLVSGHKYFVAYGCFGFGAGSSTNDPTALRCVVPGSNVTRNGNFGAVNYATIYTSNTSGTFNVRFTSLNYDGAYCRLSYCTVVDLTEAFGAGEEPTLDWCKTNIGVALDGSKTIAL